MTFTTRPLRPDDLPTVLALNNAAVPAVNHLTEEQLVSILDASRLAVAVVAADHEDVVLGFVVTLEPGADYASENFLWFEARSSDFLYVDRIVVADGSRGSGLGQVLYEAVFATARSDGRSEVFCEVNLEPPNPGSMAFHGRLGFMRIGEQATKGGSVVVAMLAAPVVG